MEVASDPSHLTAGPKQTYNPNDCQSWLRPFPQGESLSGIVRGD